jgi:hypothetical protein
VGHIDMYLLIFSLDTPTPVGSRWHFYIIFFIDPFLRQRASVHEKEEMYYCQQPDVEQVSKVH